MTESRAATVVAVSHIPSCLAQIPRPLVFTNGCFDMLHAGHVDYLGKARAMGATLWLGLNSDSSVRKLKGENRPVNHQDDRLTVLAALRSVDYLTVFEEPTPLELIKQIRPDVLVKGGDWAPKDIVGADFVRASGGQVCVIELLPGRSTSEMIRRVRKHQD